MHKEILPQQFITPQTAERAAKAISKLTGQHWIVAGNRFMPDERGLPVLEGDFGKGTPVYQTIEKNADIISVKMAVMPAGSKSDQVKLVLEKADLPALERRVGIAESEGKSFTDKSARTGRSVTD